MIPPTRITTRVGRVGDASERKSRTGPLVAQNGQARASVSDSGTLADRDRRVT